MQEEEGANCKNTQAFAFLPSLLLLLLLLLPPKVRPVIRGEIEQAITQIGLAILWVGRLISPLPTEVGPRVVAYHAQNHRSAMLQR